MYKEEHYDRLRASLNIDVMRLDDATCSMAMDQHEAGEVVAVLSNRHEGAKLRLKEITAVAAETIRNSTEGKAPSEAMVTSKLFLNRDVVQAAREENDIRLELDLWKSLATSLATRVKAIENLSGLVRSSYTSPQTIRRNELNEARTREKPKPGSHGLSHL